ncbi:MAG TPA: ribonuclease H-like YkuK family protein [Candidatus Sulfotelmatobacter sp.]|nr:ribonuclease H-like YkuK family protein [Candidatus Sulfotelmatobacter sp.]
MNSDLSDEIFQSHTHGQLSITETIEKIKIFLEENPDAQYSLVIGTDSHEKRSTNQKAGSTINLVTAILIHRKGYGGQYFWRRQLVKNIHSLREKIYSETMTSLTFAAIFVPLFKKHLNGSAPNYNLEIHVDVGEHGETRNMIKEVVGMVTGNGFVAKTKPDAYAASYVADKHT